MNAPTSLAFLQSPLPGTSVLTDGGLVVNPDQLSRLGDGDAERGRRELRHILATDRDCPTYNKAPEHPPRNVRIAGPQDEAAIMELLLLDLRENAEHIAPIDEEKVLFNVQVGKMADRGGPVGITAVIDGPNGKPVAVVVMHSVQWWWSQGWHWFETAAFVHPDHRRSRYIDDLLDFEKWVAATHTRNVGFRVYLLCGVLGAWRIRAKIAKYRRKFQLAGVACIFPAPPHKGN